jgi:hypothetical protein
VLPVFQKVNGHLTDPATGHRLRGRGAGAGRGRKGPVSRVSFGTFLLVAVIGWRAFRILGHAWFGGKKQQRGQGEGEEGELVEWASDADEDEEEQQLPPLVRDSCMRAGLKCRGKEEGRGGQHICLSTAPPWAGCRRLRPGASAQSSAHKGVAARSS